MFWGIFNSSIFSSIALLTTGSINFLIILLLISIVTLWNRGRITFSFINLFWWILFQSIFIFIWLSINQQELSIANLTSYTKHQFSFLFQENSAGIRSLPLFIALLASGMFPSTFLAIAQNTYSFNWSKPAVSSATTSTGGIHVAPPSADLVR